MVARIKDSKSAADSLAETIQRGLTEQYSANPEQFPCHPKLMKSSSRAADQITGFDNEAPWPGEWDNKTNE
jgi:hypothetical protein